MKICPRNHGLWNSSPQNWSTKLSSLWNFIHYSVKCKQCFSLASIVFPNWWSFDHVAPGVAKLAAYHQHQRELVRRHKMCLPDLQSLCRSIHPQKLLRKGNFNYIGLVCVGHRDKEYLLEPKSVAVIAKNYRTMSLRQCRHVNFSPCAIPTIRFSQSWRHRITVHEATVVHSQRTEDPLPD